MYHNVGNLYVESQVIKMITSPNTIGGLPRMDSLVTPIISLDLLPGNPNTIPLLS